MALAVDFLIVLMPLAGQDDDIVNASTGNQLRNGRATTGNEFDGIGLGKARADIGEDLLRIFSARVVIGDQHTIRQALGHFGHQRTLTAITVATAAEQAQQLAFGMRAQCLQHLLQGIGGMRVIDHHQRLAAATQALHAPDRAFQHRGDLENFVQRVIQGHQGADRREHVAQVEAPEQAAAQRVLTLGSDDHGAHAIIIEMRFAAVQRSGWILQAVADQARLTLLGCQPPTKVVIEVDHPATQVRPAEQARLGVFVGLHAAVVIEVITGQVGHHRDVECQGGDPALVQGMGRHFHGHGLGPGLLQVVEGGLHGDRVRRGQATALQGAIEAGTEGADQTAVLTEQVQRLGHQLGDAGLAVGTGDTHQVEQTAWLTIETPGDVRELRRQALDRNQRHFGDRQHGGAFGFVGNRRRTALERVGNVFTAIHARTRHRQEQVARAYVTAVQGQFADRRIAAGLGKKLAQWHRHQPRPPLAGAALTCCGGVAGGRLSGGMFIRRNVPDMTLLNTGAETRPPK
ncbi:hypothetical protein D9M71_287010 [compost metagenome]